jgi:hypothetical protein
MGVKCVKALVPGAYVIKLLMAVIY